MRMSCKYLSFRQSIFSNFPNFIHLTLNNNMTSYSFNQSKFWFVNKNFHLLFLLPQLWEVSLMHLRSNNSTDSASYLRSESLLRHDRALSHKYAPSIIIVHVVLFLELSSNSCYKWIRTFLV